MRDGGAAVVRGELGIGTAALLNRSHHRRSWTKVERNEHRRHGLVAAMLGMYLSVLVTLCVGDVCAGRECHRTS